MGGGGFLGLGPAPSAPAAPNYTAAAQATAAGNLEMAQVATAANRVNQITPYGNLDYYESGTDSQGNPMWTAKTSLNADQQALLNQQNAAAKGLGTTINDQLGMVQNTMNKPFDSGAPDVQYGGQAPQLNQITAQTPDFQQMNAQGPQLKTDLGTSGMAGWDRAQNILNQRLQPQLQLQQEQSDVKLRNQGIMPGTEAYNRAKGALGMQQNDLINQSQLTAQGIGQNLFNQDLQAGQFGNTAQNQMNQNQLANQGFNNSAQQQAYQNQMGQTQANNAINQQTFANQNASAAANNAAQQQQYNQAMTGYNMPLNTLSALRTGAQVQNPSFVNSAQQATTQGADLLGASQMQYNASMGDFNAKQAAQQSLNSGLMGLAGAGMMMSDVRLKKNIERIGTLPNGLPFYSFEYIDAVKDHPLAGKGHFTGVMAQDVEQVMPEAVITMDNGYKAVNYGLLS